MSSNPTTHGYAERYCVEVESEPEFSDDSEDDVVAETQLNFSNLSIDRRIKSSTFKGKNEEESSIDLAASELDEKDLQNYETVQKTVEAGLVEKLKLEECKIYLRKHGLRLGGTKATLIQRIKEHIDIVNCGGEKKYPASTFVVNCKGDACMGDTVMFEQDVYEMYNIASRSASGPPCGRRTVAGRIVKESYGTAKQQHTFTIEVLWSKGEKRLPPLHPLLIKGRKLYKLKTLRQKWDDEGERQKILSEKHDRGGVARLNREARIQQKEMRKVHNQTRAARNEHHNREQKDKSDISLPDPINAIKQQNQEPKTQNYSRTCIPSHQKDLMQKPCDSWRAQVVPPRGNPERQPLKRMNYTFPGDQLQNYSRTCIPSHQKDLMQKPCYSWRAQVVPPRGNPERQPLKRMNYTFPGDQLQQSNSFDSAWRSIPGGIHHEQQISYHPPLCRFVDQQNYDHRSPHMNAARNLPVQHVQACRYYSKGNCYYGDRCKFSHDLAGNEM